MASYSASLEWKDTFKDTTYMYIYQQIWNPELSEVVIAVQEGENFHNHHEDIVML